MKRKIVFATATGILIGFCYAAGAPLDTVQTLDLRDITFYGRWLLAALLATMGSVLLYTGTDLLPAFFEKGARQAVKEQPKAGRGGRAHWLCVLMLLLCWTPALLSIWPGAFSYDALDEWRQVQTGMLTAHHPLLHVLLLGGIVEGLHHITGDYNTGIAVYSILQMFVLANVFAATLTFMKERGVGGAFRIAALVYYACSPVLQLFSICATKDVLFTAAQLMLLLYLLRLTGEQETFFGRRAWQIGFGVSGFLTMALRKNGLYIMLVLLVLLFFSCKAYRRKFLLLASGMLCVWLFYAYPLHWALQVKPGGVQEMLSVPMQQMARVYRFQREELAQEDLELLYEILPREYLEAYRPTVSDNVKNGFRGDVYRENRRTFWKLWLKWGKQYPMTYVNAFLVNTVDYWYPHAAVDGYFHEDGRSSYFDYFVDEPGEEKIFLPGAHKWYETISHDGEFQRRPLVFLILSPGWYFVVTLFVFLTLWYRRQYAGLLPVGLLLLTVLSVLPGPIALVRYVLLLFAAFPLVAALFLHLLREG